MANIEGVLYSRRDSDVHLTVTLSRPEVHNALDGALVDALLQVVSSLPKEIRTVLLEGAGASFCAGADLRGWHGGDRNQQASPPLRAERLSALLAALRRLPAIVVAKVHGLAAGGGAGLLAACDLVVAARSAQICFPEVRLGLVPAVICPYVERAIGASRARYLFLTAATLDAQAAFEAGLVHRVVDDPELDAAAKQLLRSLWRGGPEALAESKWLLDAMPQQSAEQRASLCQATLERVRGGSEAAEGIRAFLAREQPAWRVP